jgi:hypothetical protein
MFRFFALIFSIVLTIPMGNLWAEPHAFPNPFVGKNHTNITFTDLPGSGWIKIFTINGEEVASLRLSPGELTKQWDVTNSAGKKLASGVYLYFINPENGPENEGKLVVIR